MSLWQEIRRRRVFRFTGVYIVGAWLVFQVADVFFPAWGVPESSLQFLLYAAFACFPVALVFSWFYDVTASGIVRTKAAEAGESIGLAISRKDYLVLAGLVIVVGAILFNSVDRVVESADTEMATVSESEKPENSLAILPFESLDAHEDTGFFSAGVSEEIMHRLASVKTLKVIGRQSSFAFGESDMTIVRISDILGVRYLLDGSIRRSGEQVRVTARLVDDSGFQIWSETFDGDLSSIFSFQSDIAETVATEITRELVVLQSPAPSQITENTEAYRLYLIGREYFTRRSPNWQAFAADAFRQSIDADGEYAPPYAGLAMVLKMGGSDWDIEEINAEAGLLIEQALQLDPLLAEAWMAKGYPDFGDPDWDATTAIENLEFALELNPLLATAYNWLAIARGQNQDLEGMLEARKRGLEVDPLHPALLMNSADIFLARNDFEGWKHQIMRLLDLPTPPRFAYQILAIKHEEYGFYSQAIHWQKLQYLTTYQGQAGPLADLIFLYEKLGLPNLADDWQEKNFELNPNSPEYSLETSLGLLVARGQFEKIPPLMDRMIDVLDIDLNQLADFQIVNFGVLKSVSGDSKDAIPLLEKYLNTDEPVTLRFNDSDDVFLLQLLAHIYMQTGSPDRAETIQARAEQITGNIFELGNFLSHPDIQLLPAVNLAARGKFAESAVALRKAFESGWRDYHAERHMPYWRGAWESEEFAPVIADIVAALEQQRAEVEAIEAEHSFQIEFEELISGK